MIFHKLIFNLFLSLILVLTILSGAFAQDSDNSVKLTDEEKLWIEQHPVIRSTNEMEWAPLDFARDGKPLGFSIDYLNLVAKKVGLKIEYVNGLPWSELLNKLRNKEIDMAQSIIQSPEREEYLNFTVPYLDLPMVYFGRQGSKHISSLNDLQNKRIGVVIDSIPDRVYKENFTDLNLVEFDSTLKALKALSAGSIDVHADILPASQYMIRTSLLPGIEVIGDKFFPETENADYIRFAARKDWPILISILEKGMAAVSQEEFVALTDKWQTSISSGRLVDIGLTREELAWLSQNNVVRVAADPTVAPLEFIDNNGEITGVTGSYLRKIAEKLNIKFETVPSHDWADSLNKIKEGQVDVIGLTTPTAERSEYLNFTSEYLISTYMIFARKEEKIIGNLDGLSGRKVAVVEGYAVIDYLKNNYPEIDIIPAKSAADALNLVASNRVDAHVGSLPMVAYNISEQGYTNIVIAGDTPYIGANTFAIRKELTLLTSAMQKALNSISAIERAQISREWIGSLSNEDPLDYALLWQIGIVVIVILVIILIWNASLRREVKRRKSVERKLIISQMRAETAQAEAEAANAAKSNFLANMSHEIRTPLNAIIGFSDAMLAGVGGQVDNLKHKEYLSDIRNSGTHLSTVINDILDLSKIEAGKWRLEECEFSLNGCLVEAIKMLTAQAEGKNISVLYSPKPINSSLKILGDLNAIKRIFINLLSNAIKYTPHDGKVECLINKKRNGQVEVAIIDNGIGIPKDRLEQVQNPFEQIHGKHDLNEEGTGLGLPIVKNLIELHNGKFTLISEIKEGTQAIITFPTKRVIG